MLLITNLQNTVYRIQLAMKYFTVSKYLNEVLCQPKKNTTKYIRCLYTPSLKIWQQSVQTPVQFHTPYISATLKGNSQSEDSDIL